MGAELSLCLIFMNNLLYVTSVWTEWSGGWIPAGTREFFLQQRPYRLWGPLIVELIGNGSTFARFKHKGREAGYLHLSAKLSMSGIIPLFPLHVFMTIRKGNKQYDDLVWINFYF
jgi:hypothetical protein